MKMIRTFSLLSAFMCPSVRRCCVNSLTYFHMWHVRDLWLMRSVYSNVNELKSWQMTDKNNTLPDLAGASFFFGQRTQLCRDILTCLQRQTKDNNKPKMSHGKMTTASVHRGLCVLIFAAPQIFLGNNKTDLKKNSVHLVRNVGSCSSNYNPAAVKHIIFCAFSLHTCTQNSESQQQAVGVSAAVAGVFIRNLCVVISLFFLFVLRLVCVGLVGRRLVRHPACWRDHSIQRRLMMNPELCHTWRHRIVYRLS